MLMKRLLVVYSLFCAVSLPQACKAQAEKNNRRKKVERKKNESGLQYEILQEGAGVSPKKGQNVTVHYTGWLNDKGEAGKKFDSSIDRGQPFTFKIGMGQVIQGWDEGVMTMKIGEKRRLFIPSHLAYGTRGIGGVIPANAALIFDVELLKVV